MLTHVYVLVCFLCTHFLMKNNLLFHRSCVAVNNYRYCVRDQVYFRFRRCLCLLLYMSQSLRGFSMSESKREASISYARRFTQTWNNTAVSPRCPDSQPQTISIRLPFQIKTGTPRERRKISHVHPEKKQKKTPPS